MTLFVESILILQLGFIDAAKTTVFNSRIESA